MLFCVFLESVFVYLAGIHHRTKLSPRAVYICPAIHSPSSEPCPYPTLTQANIPPALKQRGGDTAWGQKMGGDGWESRRAEPGDRFLSLFRGFSGSSLQPSMCLPSPGLAGLEEEATRPYSHVTGRPQRCHGDSVIATRPDDAGKGQLNHQHLQPPGRW